jgi:zinc D-Ala-D-Ala carboxypeptidase
MNLSKNFTLAELTKTSTGLSNALPNDLEANIQSLVDNILQPVRDALGVIIVTSCYRSPEVNKAIGGSSTSQHCLGQAADLKFKGGNDVLFNWLKENTDFDQLIWEFGTDEEPSWVHISYSPRHRKQILKAIKRNGKTKYLPF